MAPTPHSHPSSLLWLPDLHSLDWQARYQSGVMALEAAERNVREVEAVYRELQQDFESGLLPPELESNLGIGVEPDGSDADEVEAVSYRPWSRVREGALGMRTLHRWVDAGPLVDEGGKEGADTPPSHLFMQMDYSPGIAIRRVRTELLFTQADRHFTLLLQEQPRDVLALDYRARVRQGMAEWMRLSMLPLSQQPLHYPQAGNFRRIMEDCLNDLEQAIGLWTSAGDDAEGLPPLSRFARNLARQSLYDCYLRRYGLYWSEQRWQQALADLSSAIALRPAVGLYLARAELHHRLGLFQSEARDCLTSLTLVGAHIPTAERPQFEAGLNQLWLELELGNAALVIRRTLSFWAINPMLIQVV